MAINWPRDETAERIADEADQLWELAEKKASSTVAKVESTRIAPLLFLAPLRDAAMSDLSLL